MFGSSLKQRLKHKHRHSDEKMTALKAASTPVADIRFDNKDFKKVFDLVHQLTGIHLHDGKRELVSARLSKRMRALGHKSLGEYLSYVEEEETQEELISMLDALSTNLTSFWRESDHFDFLAEHVLPDWIKRTEKTGCRRYRLWSAGCSTGEEPYGLGILFYHHLQKIKGLDLKILATDLSTKVLGIAQAGWYEAQRVQTIPAEYLKTYFSKKTEDRRIVYRISPEIRKLITFDRLNLMESWPMTGPFDIIFCRNTMIYFTKQTQQHLINRFYDLLRSGGMLFVGHSESLAGTDHKFRYLRPTIYEKP